MQNFAQKHQYLNNKREENQEHFGSKNVNFKTQHIKNLPYISIVTVVYNAEKTIERTIESILNQTSPVFEYIIIDGNSNDKTLEKISYFNDFFADKNIKFIVISENDNGIYDAMNKGISIATGYWIGILNADDYYEINTIELVQQFLSEYNDNELIHGNINMVCDNRSSIIKPNLNLNKLYNSLSLFHPTIFIKKDIYASNRLYSLDYKLSSDWELILRFYHNKIKFGYIDRTLSNFTPGGASSGFKWIHFKERLKIRHKYFRISTLLYDLKDFIIFIWYKTK
jgi:glycosyltransferase involved in cell wall biosynthesis